MSRTALIPILAVAMSGIAAYHFVVHSRGLPPLEPPAVPARSPFGNTIAGTGIVEPWTENISLGTHTTGVVAEVLVKVGQYVEQGAVLFRLDDRQLRADVAVREALVASAKAQLERLDQQPRPEDLPGSAARVREAQARLAEEEDRFSRSTKLMERQVISEEDHGARRQALAVAREQRLKVQADDELLRAGAWMADKAVARAVITHAEAQLQQTCTELERLTVLAPVAGQVLKVNVRPGEYVAQPASGELLILGNIRPMHVRVDIDEADIPRFQAGLPARGYLRGDSERPVDLDFVRVEPYVIPKKSLSGGNTERVDTRVLPVIYAVKEMELSLYVGQQLDVFVDVSRSGLAGAEAQRSSGGLK